MEEITQNLKIAILGTAYPFRGGLAAFNERLAMELIEMGHEVTIYTFTLQYPAFLFPGKSQYSNSPAPPLNIIPILNSVNPLTWWTTGRNIRKGNFDLIISKFWLPFMGPALGLSLFFACRNKATQTLSILDNVIPHEKRPGDRWFTRIFLKRIDRFIAMSDSVLDDLKTFLPKAAVKMIPHPIYDQFCQPIHPYSARQMLGIPNKNTLLFFGFIREYKGLDLLMEALAILKQENFEFQCLIAGEFYSNENQYKALAEKLKIQDHLIWSNDFIPNEEVYKYFSAADLVVQPYKTATQSGVTQIAYHFEKPMVVTDVGGLRELVPDGKVGFVVKPDHTSIANAIKQYFSQPELKQKFLQHIKEEKKKYSWRAFCEKMLEQSA